VSVIVRFGRAGTGRRFAQAVFAVALGSCASAPRVGDADRCRVSLRDFRTGVTFSLVNRGAYPASATERRTLEEGGTKVVSPGTIDYLLERLWDEGFEEIADAGTPPFGTPGLLYAISVEWNGRARSASRRRADEPVRAQALSAMLADFREVFDSSHDLQVIENPEGPDLFESIQRTLEEKRKARGIRPGE